LRLRQLRVRPMELMVPPRPADEDVVALDQSAGVLDSGAQRIDSGRAPRMRTRPREGQGRRRGAPTRASDARPGRTPRPRLLANRTGPPFGTSFPCSRAAMWLSSSSTRHSLDATEWLLHRAAAIIATGPPKPRELSRLRARRALAGLAVRPCPRHGQESPPRLVIRARMVLRCRLAFWRDRYLSIRSRCLATWWRSDRSHAVPRGRSDGMAETGLARLSPAPMRERGELTFAPRTLLDILWTWR